MHVLIVSPMAYVSNYMGTWVLRGSSTSLEVQDHLEAGFKHPELHGCGKFHDLEGPVYGVRYPKEECIRALLFKFIEAQKPPTPCYAVWCGECYLPHQEDPFLVQTSLAAGDNKSEDLEIEELLKKRLRIARDGDHLMVIPFECDLCQFRNVN